MEDLEEDALDPSENPVVDVEVDCFLNVYNNTGSQICSNLCPGKICIELFQGYVPASGVSSDHQSFHIFCYKYNSFVINHLSCDQLLLHAFATISDFNIVYYRYYTCDNYIVSYFQLY